MIVIEGDYMSPKQGWEDEATKEMFKVELRIGDIKDRGRWRRALHGLS